MINLTLLAKLIGYVIVAALALFLSGILITIIGSDTIATIIYLRADKANGIIVEYLGEIKTSNYGRGQFPTTYYKYRVKYFAHGEDRYGEYLTRDRRTTSGDSVDVHYTTDKRGDVVVVNRNIMDRFLRLCFSFIACVLIILFLYLFTKSSLPEKIMEMENKIPKHIINDKF